MQRHVEALFVHAGRSRLVSINDDTGRAAPRFFLGRTEQGNLWRFRHDLSPELCHKLETLCKTEPITITNRPKHEAAYEQILAEQASIKRIWAGPAYWFPNRVVPTIETVRMTEQNAHLLQDELREWIPDIVTQQPFMATVVNGRATAVCASVRITEAAHEAGVETDIAHRRKGYAVSVVSGWANEVEQMGALPMYSTSFDNHASQKVAARLGLAQYGVDFHIT